MTEELQGAEVTAHTGVAAAPQHEVPRLAEHAARVGGHWSLVDYAVALSTVNTSTVLGVVARLAGLALGGTATFLAVRLVAIYTTTVCEQEVPLTACLACDVCVALGTVDLT